MTKSLMVDRNMKAVGNRPFGCMWYTDSSHGVDLKEG